MRGGLAWLLVIAAGCSGGGLEPLGTVQSGGSSQALTFAALGEAGSPLDVAVASASRGVVEVLTGDGGPWNMVGSFFAGGTAEQVVSGQVGGIGVVGVLTQDGTVAILPSLPMMPHRLGDPMQVYRRVRNGQPVDDTPPASAVTLADLDGDGSDEVAVTSGLGVAVVVDVASLLTANAEHPPPGNGFRYDAGPQPAGIAAVDFDGDGQLDLIALDQQQATAFTYLNRGGPDKLDGPHPIALPSPGASVVATGCPDAPAAVALSDGSLVLLTTEGKIEHPVAPVSGVEQLVSSGKAMAVRSTSANGVALLDTCARLGGVVSAGSDAAQVALAASSTVGLGQMAVLGKDGQTVSVYRVISGF